MKNISLRPKQQLMNMFDAVQNMENLPSTNRNSIIDRALDMALKSNYVNWNAVSEVSIENKFESKVPNHIVLKVDETKFATVNEQIKTAFKVEKITIPYTLKLLLTLYFIHLKQQTDNANQSEHMSELLAPAEGSINTLLLKSEYEQSIYSSKRRLLDVSKVYLRNNLEIHANLATQCQADMQAYHNFVDLSKYLSGKATKTAPNSTYLAKVIAGLLILRVESVYETNESKMILDQVLQQMEIKFNIVDAVIDNNVESVDYYKNVYAKMMGGKI